MRVECFEDIVELNFAQKTLSVFFAQHCSIWYQMSTKPSLALPSDTEGPGSMMIEAQKEGPWLIVGTCS